MKTFNLEEATRFDDEPRNHLGGNRVNKREEKAINLSFKSDLLNRKQAAEYLGVTPATLAVWACTKRYKLSFVKVGRLVKYRRSDLEMFINERRVNVER